MTAQVPVPSAEEGIAVRHAAVVSCWLCGIGLHEDQMVPDGGSACADSRWYCKDVRGCAERWTSSLRQVQAAGGAERAG